jgi:hypothetical protein
VSTHRLLALTALVCLAGSPGCAKITATSEVRIVPKEEAPRLVGAGLRVVERDYDARWMQMDDELWIEFHERRRCRELWHVPVLRVEKIRRTAGPTLAWEYAVTAAMLGFASFAFASPGTFSSSYVDTEGTVITPTGPGYRTGGLFLGIGTIGLIASVHDTIQARDSEIFADAFQTRDGADVPCAVPTRALAQHEVRLIAGAHESLARTDDQGRARLDLPPRPAAETRTPSVIRASVAIDGARAVAVDYRVPYGSSGANGLVHVGQVRAEPESP